MATWGPDDDVNDPARRFSGVTFGVALPRTWLGGSKLYLDPFLGAGATMLGAWGGRVGPARRYDGGARLWGDVGRMAIDWSVNHQCGPLYRPGHRCVAGISSPRAIVSANRPPRPRIGFHADYASGGGGYGDGKLRNAYAPFGNNIYYSYQPVPDAFEPDHGVAPTLAFSPVKGVRVTAEYELGLARRCARRRVPRQRPALCRYAEGHGSQDRRCEPRATGLVDLAASVRHRPVRASGGGPVAQPGGFGSSDFLSGWVSFRF